MQHLARLILIVSALALAGCKADRFDVSLATGDLAGALAGAVREAPFEMEFRNVGELDDARRADLKSFEAIMRKYMAVDSFELVPGSSGAQLTIEGRLPVAGEGGSAAPYYLRVAPSADFPGYTEVEMVNGADYAAMREEMQDVEMMLTPDRYQPTRIKLAGNGEKVIAPGAYVDGEARALFTGKVGERLWLSFKDGVWDDTGAYFLVALP